MENGTKKLGVFICGANAFSNRKEREVLSVLYQSAKKVPVARVTNEPTLLPPTTQVTNTEQFMLQVEEGLQRADVALVDLTYPSAETIAQMTLADRMHNIPLKIFYNDLTTPRLPLNESHSRHPWHDGRSLEEDIKYLLQNTYRFRSQRSFVDEEEERKGIERLYIRTGLLAIDLRHRRLLHGINQVPLTRPQYTLVEGLAKNVGEPVDEDKLREYWRSRLANTGVTDELFRQYFWDTAYKVNRLEGPRRRYMESEKGKYKLRRYAAETTELPLMRKFGELEGDFTNGEVWYRGEEIDLTRLGKTAILFLMNNHGVELSKSAFCEAVWPGKKVYDSQYNQLVNRIKRELGDNTQNPNGLILQNRGTIQLIDGSLE